MYSTKKLDLLGKTFGHLLVLEDGPNKNKLTTKICKCFCGKILVVKTASLIHWGKKHCGCLSRDEFSYRKYYQNDNFFSEPNLLNSYWAGFIAADGCINKNFPRLHLELSRTDEKHLLSFKKDTGYTGVLSHRQRIFKTKICNFCKLQISSRKWKEDLYTNFNLTPNKTFSLTFPSLSEDNTKSFLKGLIDGDGHIGKDKDNYLIFSFTSGSFDMMSFISKYIFSVVEKNPTIYKDKNCYSISLFGKTAFNFLYPLFILNTPFLERKWNKLNNVTKKGKISNLKKDEEDYVDTEGSA